MAVVELKVVKSVWYVDGKGEENLVYELEKEEQFKGEKEKERWTGSWRVGQALQI